MKQISLLVTVALLLTLLAGCHAGDQAQTDPTREEPLHLEALNLELSRGELDSGALRSAVTELPELLAAYFAEAGVEIDEIKVTVGSSPANTVQALEQGGVQLAFLPAEGFFTSEGTGSVLFADAEEAAAGALKAGTRSLICAAPTEYGTQLSSRASSGKPLSWQELEHARWGVPEPDSLGGSRCFDLWLADNFEGNRITDLPQVTRYDSYEALFRASAAGEIDALVLQEDVRGELAEAWTLDTAQTDENGIPGFGREADIREELPVLEVTERLYRQLAVVTPDLSDARFAAALEQVLNRMAEEMPEQMVLLGAERFAPVTEDALNATRRAAALD